MLSAAAAHRLVQTRTQQTIVPSLFRAQVCLWPAAIWATPVRPEGTVAIPCQTPSQVFRPAHSGRAAWPSARSNGLAAAVWASRAHCAHTRRAHPNTSQSRQSPERRCGRNLLTPGPPLPGRLGLLSGRRRWSLLGRGEGATAARQTRQSVGRILARTPPVAAHGSAPGSRPACLPAHVPKQVREPSLSKAQVWAIPAEICAALESPAGTVD